MNLASITAHADTKSNLRKQLISMRDGDNWHTLKRLPEKKLLAFELLGEVKGDAQFQFGDKLLAKVQTRKWSPIRIRVAGRRSQVWLNNRVTSDASFSTDILSGFLTCTSKNLRKIRLREI